MNYKTLLNVYLYIVILLFINVVQAVTLNVTPDRASIIEGESLNLSITATGSGQGHPDFTVLNKDFTILSQAQSTRMTIINGQTNSTREWQLVIIPKRNGNLTIPALHLGSTSSQPIKVEVLPEDKAGNIGKSSPIFLEVDTDTKTPYIQGQVIYTLRIFSKVPMQRASLREPRAENTILERLGDDRTYKAKRYGIHYSVIERRYAIFPQRSGLVTIEPPVFTVMIPEPKTKNLILRDPFFRIPFGDPFSRLSNPFTRPIQKRGHSIILDVKPQPPGTHTPWLPAKALEISEIWQPNELKLRLGEAVTRTITIKAQS
ncbi:hypothetical protein TI05_07880, partial [Achromatium sp. WMS3]